MRVLLDVSNLGLAHESAETRTGIFRATEALVRELLAVPSLDLGFAALESFVAELQLLRYDRSVEGRLGDRIVRVWESPSTDPDSGVSLVDELDEVGRETSEGKRILAELSLLNRLARPVPVHGFEIVHSLKHPLRPMERVPRARRVVTVHDMVPVLFPDLSEDRFVSEHAALMRSIEPGSDWLICNSESTRSDACRILSFPQERTFVTPFAADPKVFRPFPQGAWRREILARHGIGEGPYLLSLCTIEPRKNLMALLDAFFAIASEAGRHDVSLVLVGPTGWKSGPFFERLEQRADLRDRIVLTGYVPDAEISAIYSGARAFVYPSFYEGFGLPPLEAMQCGTPVVTSNAGSLPEVTGEAALLVDPSDTPELAAALRTVLEDDLRAARLAAEGLERSRAFSWSRTAEETVAAYDVILGRDLGA